MLDATAAPAELGFSPERLAAIPRQFEADVADGRIAGAVMIVARGGRIALHKAVGYRDRKSQAPMGLDTIFRLASLTKPVTSVAALMLAERGELDLLWPIYRLIPAFKSIKVGQVADENREFHLVAPERPPRLFDLFRHTSGITYGIFGQSEVKTRYNQADVLSRQQTSADMAAKLASLPLAYQPGTTWDYGMSTDLLGHLVELISGMNLDSLVRDRIADPLGLDTFGYWIPERDAGRLAEAVDAEPGSSVAEPPRTSLPTWAMAGGGMYSTALDYAKFAQMLLNGGQAGVTRILSRKTVDLMTADQLPPGMPRDRQFMEIMSDLGPAPEYAQGFGLGVARRNAIGPSPVPGSIGDFFWQGVTGPYFWVDPVEQLVCILMIQVPFYMTDRYRRLFRRLVYGALTGHAQTQCEKSRT